MPKEREEADWDDPLEQMIEWTPHTITKTNGTIRKHTTFVTDSTMLFHKHDKLTKDHECWTYIKPHARAEMAEQPTWPSSTIVLGPTKLAMWQPQQSTS